MMDATLRIKNLSIALEALSRINTGDSFSLYERIVDLLKDEIITKEKENQWPQRPARTATTNTDYDPFNPSKL